MNCMSKERYLSKEQEKDTYGEIVSMKKEHSPLVSVIIPTYNRPEMIVNSISSVLKQTFRDFEIIVIDDGSSDRTGEILTTFHTDINYIVHLKNLGVSAARNSGIRASEAPLIAFLDSDDYWLPEKLETQVRFFQEPVQNCS